MKKIEFLNKPSPTNANDSSSIPISPFSTGFIFKTGSCSSGQPLAINSYLLSSAASDLKYLFTNIFLIYFWKTIQEFNPHAVGVRYCLSSRNGLSSSIRSLSMSKLVIVGLPKAGVKFKIGIITKFLDWNQIWDNFENLKLILWFTLDHENIFLSQKESFYFGVKFFSEILISKIQWNRNLRNNERICRRSRERVSREIDFNVVRNHESNTTAWELISPYKF